jgi:hypothetical protein
MEDIMDDPSKTLKPKEFQINIGDEMSRGRYSNSMMVSHSADEFILDWLLNAPNGTHLLSRIIVSPAHVKRIISALKENLDNYEKRFGNIRETVSVDHKFH